MKTGDHKILAGLILASIHINLFHVMLLPPCIGFLILYIGILTKRAAGGIFPDGCKRDESVTGQQGRRLCW